MANPIKAILPIFFFIVAIGSAINFLPKATVLSKITTKKFTTNEIISSSKDVINDYFSKSIESIFEIKDHALFPVLENINNYLINRTS